MARGWESKAVEDQIGEKEAEREARARPELSPDERARRAERASLMLARTSTENAMRAARDPRHREQLERALAEIDARLATLD